MIQFMSSHCLEKPIVWNVGHKMLFVAVTKEHLFAVKLRNSVFWFDITEDITA